MQKLILINDVAHDPDDEHALILASWLHKLGHIEILTSVVNLEPAIFRAQIAKGMFNAFEIKIPVGVGEPVYLGQNFPEEGLVPYLARDVWSLENGQETMTKVLLSAPESSVTLVLMSGMTDAAKLLREKESLFKEKVRCVVVMGGVKVEDGKFALENGFMIPNNANNNAFDMPAALFLYQRLQEAGIPMVIVTREAAYAAKIPFSTYDRFEATESPIGISLSSRHKQFMQQMWEAACSPDGSKVRKSLPPDRDRGWFNKVFCGDEIPTEVTSADPVWKYVKNFSLYDPITVVAAVPELRVRMFDPSIVKVCGTDHMVIGVSSQNHGVSNTSALVDFMIDSELMMLAH